MINNILKIFDENNNEIIFHTLEIKYEKTKQSSIYSNILYIDNIGITGKKRNLYKVLFKCNCGNISQVSLKYYLSKKEIHCNKCSNRNHVHNYENKNINNIDKNFNNYSDEFKNKYWNTHLHLNEFNKYINKIYSLNEIILTDNIKKNIIFYEHDYINNQAIFTSKFSLDNGITKINLKYVKIKCDICNKIFKLKPFNLRNHKDKIRCRKCNFETINYKLKKYNDTLTYQSKLEKYFLDKCFEKNIKVMNGFEIPYYFNNKLRTYISDFYLPDLKIIIEIKGNNPYYKKDLNSGKIDAKNNAAINYANIHNMKFEFILEDIDNFFNKITI